MTKSFNKHLALLVGEKHQQGRNFSIFNETRENHGAGYVIFAGRPAQVDQWEDVMGNARKFLGKEKKDVQMQENIKTYKYDETQPMGKGKLTSDKTEKINE